MPRSLRSSDVDRAAASALRATLLALVLALVFVAPRPSHAAEMPSGWLYPTGSSSTCGYQGWLRFNSAFGGYHLAIDICRAEGGAIYAIGDGEVVRSSACVGGYGGPSGGVCGGAVVVRHQAADGTWFTALYGHLDSPRALGAVSAGDMLGYANDWDPPHLHFGIHPGFDVASGNPWRGYTESTSNLYGFVEPMGFLAAHPRGSAGSCNLAAPGASFTPAAGPQYTDPEGWFELEARITNCDRSRINRVYPIWREGPDDGLPRFILEEGIIQGADLPPNGTPFTLRAHFAGNRKWVGFEIETDEGLTWPMNQGLIEVVSDPSVLEGIAVIDVGRPGDPGNRDGRPDLCGLWNNGKLACTFIADTGETNTATYHETAYQDPPGAFETAIFGVVVEGEPRFCNLWGNYPGLGQYRLVCSTMGENAFGGREYGILETISNRAAAGANIVTLDADQDGTDEIYAITGSGQIWKATYDHNTGTFGNTILSGTIPGLGLGRFVVAADVGGDPDVPSLVVFGSDSASTWAFDWNAGQNRFETLGREIRPGPSFGGNHPAHPVATTINGLEFRGVIWKNPSGSVGELHAGPYLPGLGTIGSGRGIVEGFVNVPPLPIWSGIRPIGGDGDGDGYLGSVDNCQGLSNPDQADVDQDGQGDVCDACTDVDRDGYGLSGAAGCPGGSELDCDDTDPAVNPGASELCNGLDENCDDVPDETFPELGDVCTVGVGVCEAAGSVICAADELGTECDASAGTPGGEGPTGSATCGNGLDDDCDGLTDEADPDCASACTDSDGDGYAVEGDACGPVDCDDGNSAVNPGAAEIPGNGVDDDCDPSTPPGCNEEP